MKIDVQPLGIILLCVFAFSIAGCPLRLDQIIPVDVDAPKVTDGTVSDGEIDVDPDRINTNAVIEVAFNEPVEGVIALQDETGGDVGWIGKVQGNKATLQLVKNRELTYETTYVIAGKVSDATGNPTDFKITFMTAPESDSGGPPPVLEGMVRIPAGEFQMGSDDVDAKPLEQPIHVVHLDTFYIDEHEVTNAQYKAFLLENPEWQKDRIEQRFHTGNYLFDWKGNDYPEGQEDYPATEVSWYAAMAYAEWAGKRLPTEAEWEKAARGGLIGQKYPSGNTIDRNQANYNKHINRTGPVQSYPANDYGLYDMAGNAWEWCLDEAIPNFYDHSPPNNPIAGGPLKHIIDNFRDVATGRIIRGGSWATTAVNTRVSHRGAIPPQRVAVDVGFRCAFTP